jgi:multidrug efflux pump subunit AcrA (membrane-fusion protein)
VKLELPLKAAWRSGQFGRAVFPGAAEDVVAIPANAVRQQGQIRSVQVVSDSNLRMRLVTVGRSSGENVEVLSGLQPGETILSPVHLELSDGTRIEARF